MICTYERGSDEFRQNTLVASLIINPLVVAPRATTTALHNSPFNYCVSVVKEIATATKPWQIQFDFFSPTNWNLITFFSSVQVVPRTSFQTIY